MLEGGKECGLPMIKVSDICGDDTIVYNLQMRRLGSEGEGCSEEAGV
jgi:hypothetical protein